MAKKETYNDSAMGGTNEYSSDRAEPSFRLWIEVKDVMSERVVTIFPEETASTAARMMAENKISCMVVVDDGIVSGILTESDFLKRAAQIKRDFDEITVAEVMTCPVETVPPDYSILKASKIVVEKCIKRLPVIEDDKLIGVITQTDLIRALTPYGMQWEIKNIMNRDVTGVQSETSVAEVAAIMASRNISCIAVFEDKKVAGIFTERDLVKKVIAQRKDPTSITVGQVMSGPPVTVPPDCSVFKASRMMERMKIRRLVVMEDKQLCGIVTQTDILMAVRKRLQTGDEKNVHVLIIDGDKEDAKILRSHLSRCRKYTIKAEYAGSMDNALKKLSCGYFDLIFLANRLGGGATADKMLKRLGEQNIDVPVIIVTGRSDQQTAIDLMKMGAYDYITKNNLKPELIERAIRTISERHSLKVMQKQSEEALQQSEERYRRITNAITDYIYTVRLEDGQVAETVHNEACIAVTGYSSEEFASDPYLWINMVHPDDQQKVCKQASQCVSGEQIEPLEHRIVHKDGSVRWLKSTLVRCYDVQGNLVAYDGLLQDITERKEAEEKMRRARDDAEKAQQQLEILNHQLEASVERANLMTQQAIAADSAKSQFLANMSHEIRTPMNAIIGFSEVLAEEQLSKDQQHYVDIIHQSAESLLQLINDILDFSKIEAGKLNVEVIDCSLERLFTAIELLIRPQAKKKGLEFEIIQNSQLPAKIRTDPVRLRQCLLNLTNNAVKFTEKGHVYVYVSLDQGDGEPYIRFDVEDTGIGIAADKQELIFEIFTQTDSGTARKYGGTGLGLAITRQLAHLLNGELSLKSELGKGSVFSLVIPAGIDVTSEPVFGRYSRKQDLGIEKESLEQEKFSGRALVAEDSKTNQVLIRILLERLGLEVTLVEDGDTAVDKALNGEYDLIFMDIQMPNMSGYEAAKVLRRNKIGTPIVALTAHAMKGDKEKCLSAGCDGYLSKPISRKKLMKILRRYLSSGDDICDEEIDAPQFQPAES